MVGWDPWGVTGRTEVSEEGAIARGMRPELPGWACTPLLLEASFCP